MTLARLTLPALLACLLGFSLGAAAQSPPRIDELSYLDHQYMEQQRTLLEDLARRNYGSGFSGDKERDLKLLQDMLDDRVVRPDQTRELQAMGLIMGDLLAEDLGMHWVVYEDSKGRSRALRYLQTDNYLFPVTMISRRREAGNDKPVVEIYQKAYDIIAPLRPDMPFQ